MKSTHKNGGVPICFVNIKFFVCALHLELAIISLLIKGQKTTKSQIKKELITMLRSGGADGAPDWVSEDDQEKYIAQARSISKYLFTSFY